MTSQFRLKRRQKLSEIEELNIFDFNKKIDDSKSILDIYMIITRSDFANSKFNLKLISMNIVNLFELKKAIIEQFEMLWKILKCLRKNRNMNIVIIRAWNVRENFIITKNRKHSLKLNEINETFEINKIEIIKTFNKFNKKFIVIRNLESKFKEKIKNEFSNFQNMNLSKNINYDETIDFLKTRSRNKKMSSKYIDSFIF